MYRPPRNPVPPGWFECPDIGEVSDMHHLIPMKVPLGDNHRFPHMQQYSQGQWTPQIALDTAAYMIKAKNPVGKVGMVLDLSNSDKYYNHVCFENCSVRYCKVPCRGRGQSPEPLAVNMAVWEIQKTLAESADYYILVHCTHGFNRSGFIIISALMRLLEKGYCVERGIRHFREQRPPGIYKNDYINDLFARHCEIRPRSNIVPTPAVPEWKPADDEDEDDRLAYNLVIPTPALAAKMTHADKIGEPVCCEENRYIMNVVYDIIMGQDAAQRMAGMPPGVVKQFPLPHLDPSVMHRPNGDLFVGSQPVSLDLKNLDLVKTKRYFVTWKADGTRYLMLIKREGVYLIDRAGEVRRTHMRFPTLLPQLAAKGQHPVGPLHHWTLLDGEMVVDDVDMGGDVQRRRYLVYDCMMLAGEGISDLSFGERYQLIDKQILRPLVIEKEFYKKYPNPKFLYDWNLELCSIRRKEFWPLYKAKKLLEEFIPRLCHESDGLILQPWDDPYIPRTYPHLLKWKFSHMNSVDFKLFALPDQPVRLQLNCGTRRKYGQAEVNHMSLQDIGLGEQRVEFPADANPYALHAKIVECNFNAERRVWTYMRDRPDKLNANHRSVFDKVMASIFDNIDEEKLLGVFDEALKTRPDIYKQEIEWIKNPQATLKPSAAPTAAAVQDGHASQDQLQQQQQRQHPQQQQQRSQTPEVRQLPHQQQLRPGMRGPSPILTPPPGAAPDGDSGRIENERLADAAGLVDDLTPGLEKTADSGDGTRGGEGGATDGDMHGGEDDMVDYDPELHDEDEGGLDNDAEYMQDYDQQYEQQEDGEHHGPGEYKVTEEEIEEVDGAYNAADDMDQGDEAAAEMEAF